MQRVFVLDSQQRPLMPCHPARARELLRKGRAAVFRRYPFTIILSDRAGGDTQPIALKVDPGARTTGVALVADGRRGKRVVWAAEITHRGGQIRKALLSRRQRRRARRTRKLRYRPPRFQNRRRLEGWLPPSLLSRVGNIMTWAARLRRIAPITTLSMELVRFDTQAMQNPEISGVEYQQGTLAGYEVREYLLEKWKRRCVYCGAENVPLEVEHIMPKSRGGSDRVSNLALSCTRCNLAKGNRTASEFGHPEVQAATQKPLRDAAMVNATRWALWRALSGMGLPLETGTGGRTRYNRIAQGYPKAHWIDAACVGVSGARVYVNGIEPLGIKAMRRGKRQMCLMNRYGFPRTGTKRFKRVGGFQTGDVVRAVVPAGQHAGAHVGRVAVRASGSFRVGARDGIAAQYCHLLHRGDGYEYTKGAKAHSSAV